MAGIGHNYSPLHERIFSDPEISVEDVLAAVSTHIKSQNHLDINHLSTSAAALSTNQERLPETFGQIQITSALNLLAHMDAHADRVTETKASMLGAAETFVSNLKKDCKPLDEGIAPLEKILRARIVDGMIEHIDAHNSERTEHEDLMGSLTLKGSSGARATLSIGEEIVIEAEAEIPREFCTPCPKLIAAAIKSGTNVPGVKQKRKPSLRITTK